MAKRNKKAIKAARRKAAKDRGVAKYAAKTMKRRERLAAENEERANG